MKKLRGVEAARGIAAVLVVFRHATDLLAGHRYLGVHPLGDFFVFGNSGVDFFFVLSGFIIYYVHRNDVGCPARVGGYAWRRFARIYPTYWAVMAGFALILLYSPERDPAVTSLGNIVASMLLLPRLQDPILGVAWTLRHEVLFYLLFATLLINRRLGLVVLSGWAGAILWNILVYMVTGAHYFHGLPGQFFFRICNLEFFFGIGVAILVARGRFWRPRTLLVVGAILFLANGVIESFGLSLPIEWPPHQLAFALGAALALYGLVGAEQAGTFKVPEPLFALGTASYSIYLTHLIAIMVLEQAIRVLRHVVSIDPTVTFCVISALAIAGGIMFSRLVEQPLLRRLRRGPPWSAAAAPVRTLPSS